MVASLRLGFAGDGERYDPGAGRHGQALDPEKTELIANRVWRSRSQLELAVVSYVAWFNNDCGHADK